LEISGNECSFTTAPPAVSVSLAIQFGRQRRDMIRLMSIDIAAPSFTPAGQAG
jgi:hypothetical protein